MLLFLYSPQAAIIEIQMCQNCALDRSPVFSTNAIVGQWLEDLTFRGSIHLAAKRLVTRSCGKTPVRLVFIFHYFIVHFWGKIAENVFIKMAMGRT